MAAPTDPATRQRVLEMARANPRASDRAIGRAVGLGHSAVGRIRASAFDGASQGPANIPPPSWSADQPTPPPTQLVLRPGYHDRTFKSYGAPLAFDGFTIERARNAVSLHRQGFFLESSLLAIAIMSFGPVIAALGQRVAPMLALPRHVRAGTRGLSRVLGAEVEAQIAPQAGLAPSPYFPPTLWGAIAIDLAFMGFAVLQHVLGDEDPETGVRPVYSRRWPTWATNYYRYRRTFVALTSDGPVDILNDGKFTLIADSDEPHFSGAIVALAEEVLDGKFTQRSRASYIDKYSNPKWVGIMPPKTGVNDEIGDAYFDALDAIRNPDGFGVLPHGSEFDVKEMSSSQSTVFKDALESNWQYVAAILLGSDGTLSQGTGGVYTSPTFKGVRRDLVDRDLKASVRGVNQGHVRTYLDFNYSASIASAAGWTDPVLDIPLPDPEADARIKSCVERNKALVDQIALERAQGFMPTQERVDQLAKSFDVDAPTLTMTPIEDRGLNLKLVAPDEYRAGIGLPPLPGGMGTVDQLANERKTGKDQVSGRGVLGFDPTTASAYVDLAKSAGLQPSVEGVAAILAESGLGSQPIPQGTTPAGRIDLAPTDLAKIVRVDEARVANGLPALGPPDGEKMIGEIGGAGGGDPAPPGGNGGVPGGDPAGVNDGAAESATTATEPAAGAA